MDRCHFDDAPPTLITTSVWPFHLIAIKVKPSCNGHIFQRR
jgi:hypothetical protein